MVVFIIYSLIVGFRGERGSYNLFAVGKALRFIVGFRGESGSYNLLSAG